MWTETDGDGTLSEVTVGDRHDPANNKSTESLWPGELRIVGDQAYCSLQIEHPNPPPWAYYKFTVTGVKRDAKKGRKLKDKNIADIIRDERTSCLLYTSPSPRDGLLSRMPSSA